MTTTQIFYLIALLSLAIIYFYIIYDILKKKEAKYNKQGDIAKRSELPFLYWLMVTAHLTLNSCFIYLLIRLYSSAK